MSESYETYIYKCKYYEPADNSNCWPDTCPITKYNFMGKYKSHPCRQGGMVYFDWTTFITMKNIIEENFTKI